MGIKDRREEVIAIICQPYGILLGKKKKKFGKGKYNGFGGGVEKGETLEEAVIRETFEEAGIIIKNPEKMGKILFTFDSDEKDHLVHFFKATDYIGLIEESDEMIPEWFETKKIPYENMWDDDKYWLPLLLQGKKFEGNFHYNKDSKIVNYGLDEVPTLR
ncbi:ADP-ribose pyrophosphatase [uncultured archaeon]|nr:ADP-ribose pyrophosphatase [uncultured archaeon]